MKPDALDPGIILHDMKALGSPAELFLDPPLEVWCNQIYVAS